MPEEWNSPGLWFSTNTLVKINAAPQWQDSLNKNKGSMSFYEGGPAGLHDCLQYWYDRGIRMFKFDFVDFAAATPDAEKTQTPQEISLRNQNAFREALRTFRQKNPDVVLEGFNGFGGDVESTDSPLPFSIRSICVGWRCSTPCTPVTRVPRMFPR